MKLGRRPSQGGLYYYVVQAGFALAAVWGEVLEAGGLRAGNELEQQECGHGEVIRARGKPL